jgi:DNA-directed RNA polymerase III subunit RPC8
VRVSPEMLTDNCALAEVVKLELNKRFANKVIHEAGLCVCVFDVLEMGDAYILAGDAGAHLIAQFRLVVFRPFVNEVLIGKVKQQSRDGLKLTLDFFDDIEVPDGQLPSPSTFDEVQQRWSYGYAQEDGSVTDLPIYTGEQIRLRIVSEHFVDVHATFPPLTDVPPYSLVASINGHGLGPLRWWQQ